MLAAVHGEHERMSSVRRGETRRQQIYDREGRNTSSMDPKMMNARVFIGNLAAEKVTRQDVMKLFQPYGKVLGVSLHKSYGFVQFDNEEEAKEAVKATNGSFVEGLRVDVNIATERRKEVPLDRPRGSFGGRRGQWPRSPSPPFRHHHHHDRFEMDRPPAHWERGWRGSPPPMGGVPYHEPERDPHYDRFPPLHARDPYFRPRDDPYEHIPRDRERFGPPRDHYGPPRENFPPPRDRYPYDYPPRRGSSPPNFDRGGPEWDRRVSGDEWEREREKRATIPPAKVEGDVVEGKGVDMEIIVINRQQRDYASLVATRVRELGLVVEIQQLSPTVSLADALDSAAHQGLLYAIIITSQHEMHRSVTLTILHGRNPQEHKNMPLQDALSLIRKDSDRSIMSRRAAPRKPAPSSDVPHLLGKAASGASLSSNELSAVISALQKKQQHDEMPTSTHHAPPDKADTNTPEDIQRQQADLQAKILSLLGSNAVVPSTPPTKPPTALSGPSAGTSYNSGKSRGRSGGGTSSAAAAGNYSQQSYSNSGGYSARYDSTSAEGNSGYGPGYGAYDYR